MPVFLQLERLPWVYNQVNTGRRPNAIHIAQRFEILFKTVQRNIT